MRTDGTFTPVHVSHAVGTDEALYQAQLFLTCGFYTFPLSSGPSGGSSGSENLVVCRHRHVWRPAYVIQFQAAAANGPKVIRHIPSA